MSLGLRESLVRSVTSKYASAVAAGALKYSPTELKVIQINNIPFQLRYCPSLSEKPTPLKATPAQPEDSNKEKFDPFADPDPALHICDIPNGHPSHTLVLNKFPIIKNHFILATKENKPQTRHLEEDDLWLTYQCLQAWEQDDPAGSHPSQLFAFFNSGPHSGASQPHRHLQLMPIDDMREGDAANEWNILTEEIIKGPGTWDEDDELAYFRSHRDIPFRHFATKLPAEPNKKLLHQLYLNLYETSLSLVSEYIEAQDSDEEFDFHSDDDGDLPISYNLAMTTHSMIICPRRKGGVELARDDESIIDTIEANGTILGGTVLTKNKEAWDALKGDSPKLQSVLKGLGIPALPRGASALFQNA